MESLEDYIGRVYGGNKEAFARANGVLGQQVSKWVKSKFIVVNDALYSKRRELVVSLGDTKQQCFSCETEFTPESHNDLDGGWFCDDCIGWVM